MKKYIDSNNEKRTTAAKSFEKHFFKLMVNSVYDKTMENLRKRINVRLVNDERDFFKYTSRPIQLILLIKSLAEIMLLFMKLDQF